MQGKKTEEGIPKLREHVQIRTKSKHVAFSSDDDAVGGHKNPSYVETLLQKQRKKDLATRHKNLRERKSITHTHTHTQPYYLMWLISFLEHKFWFLKSSTFENH